ncbi:YeaC family protein [Alteromonas sp. CYL-A6]|uniref:YeaC family protein n=1 Tax=Alteromonas nitratireducens TaxID=3390813 RepID=UPI0034BD2CD8
MNVDALLQAMTPEVFERLRTAVETGKWQDGTVLSQEQRDNCMQAVMLYQAKVAKSQEHMTVNEQGEIVHKTKQDFLRSLKGEDDNTIARFRQDDL